MLTTKRRPAHTTTARRPRRGTAYYLARGLARGATYSLIAAAFMVPGMLDTPDTTGRPATLVVEVAR